MTPRQKIRTGLPLTLAEVAAQAGCSLRQVQKWAAGQHPVLPTYRVGVLRRVRAEDAEALLLEIGALAEERRAQDRTARNIP